MIIDIEFVDVLMIFATALSIVLRASRHLSSSHHASPVTITSPQAHHHSDDGGIGNYVLPPSTLPGRRRRFLEVLASAPGRLRHQNDWWAALLPQSMHDLSVACNVLSLISNCLTHLLRHSQVLYAMLLVMCDVVMAGRDRPQRRAGYMLSLLSLLVMLYILHERTLWFAFGDWCGYCNGLAQVFLLGVTVGNYHHSTFLSSSNGKHSAAPSSSVVGGMSSAVVGHHHHHHLVVEYTLERATACVSTMCYLAMLLDEGEAVYSSHSEFVRWYVANAALLMHDAILMWQFLRRGSVIHGMGSIAVSSGDFSVPST
ncbi:GPI-anchored surface protein, putative [Bodo saltans]|uniref:GPI-anchored surface protein, putative n=1 Tax=Bodo saltans TaxID=75058 RepID=A0A0S4IPP3_BODSA|nr:GPI-anchored surface protein, putative [Bodo saltans]|eukprot:CUF04122.1 GPI-anchored surface protein, putative [Bodo saltans]